MASFHTLTIADVARDTEHATVLTFDVPPDLKDAFAFTPGQYLTLRAEIDGQDTRRSYSICAALGAPLAVGIKQIEGGTFSTFAQSLRPGDTLQVMPPEGRFTAEISGQHRYLLIAAGSGITPILSIAASVLEGEPASRITLLFANQRTETVMFREALEDLKDRHLSRFRLTHIMSREAQDIAVLNGRIDAEKLEALTASGLIDPKANDAIYICGPQPMTQTAAAAFKAMGIDDAKIKTELFTASTPPSTQPKPKPIPEGATVEVILDGTRKSFAMNGDTSVIEAAAKAGFELPYSCANGMCATCRCKLAEGDATMTQNFSLEDWECDAGYVLACQTRPVSDKIVLDFDAV